MIPRIAGIVSHRPDAVHDFLHRMTVRYAAYAPGTVQVISFPSDQPVVAIAVADGRRPQVSCYRAPDGAFVVLDGEVYDFGDELPTEVPGTGAVNQAERIFQLYQRRGFSGLARVDAGATITIWNPDSRELRIFRDACGIVTAFYGTRNADIVFASDMEALLAAGVPRRIDRHAIDYYLSKGYAPGPWCFIEGIRKIPPGHQLACQPGSAPTVTRYFRQATKPKLSVNRKQRNERIRDLLGQALRRRCEPDRSTAVLVSGGIDSMLILSSLVKIVGARAEAYTFSYSDYSGPFNEEDPARKLAAHLGVRHETVLYQPKDIADGLQQILRDYGEPLAWGLHSFMLRSLVRREIGTIFTGVEPEWNLRKVDLAAIRFRQLPAPLRSVLRAGWGVAGGALPKLSGGAASVLQTEKNGLPPQFLRSSIMDEDLRRAIYVDPDWAKKSSQASLELFLAALDELRDEDPYDQARLMDHRFLDADGVLFWNSVWARSYDLVVRHPYCDRDLRDFFYQLRGDMSAKSHLREFAATFLPSEIANAPRLPHTIPIGHWFRGPLREFLLDHLSPANLRGGLFRPEVVKQLIADHIEGRADNTWRLWALLSLSSWMNML